MPVSLEKDRTLMDRRTENRDEAGIDHDYGDDISRPRLFKSESNVELSIVYPFRLKSRM